MDFIRIRGARTHNLKNVSLDLPRDRLIVITGLSGSGKSSLAFDTLYAEGQRRYVESLSAYARQFLQLMEKPDVDLIEGLSPAISIEQKATSHNPRSTVGTVTEIHDYLRLLFARIGEPRCPDHDQPLAVQTVSQMVDHVLALPEDSRVMVLSPVITDRKGEQADLFEDLRAQGFVRVRVDGEVHDLDAVPRLDRKRKHSIEVVVDRLKVRDEARQRLAESFETALRLSDGRAVALEMDSGREHLFSQNFACPVCGYSLAELEPRLFSFNNPVGACPRCDGLGVVTFFDAKRVVAFPQLSLASGAIKGWDRRNQFYFMMLQSLARHYGFSTETPFEALAEEHQQVILNGSGRQPVAFTYLGERGNTFLREHSFEGIIPTSSGATARPIRRWCARNWRATSTASPVRPARAHASAARRSSCSSAARRCTPSRASRCTTQYVSSTIWYWPDNAPRSPRRWSRRSAHACSSSSTSGSTTCPSTVPPTHCPVARHSASVSPARSARA